MAILLDFDLIISTFLSCYMNSWQLLPVALKASIPLKKFIFIIFSNPINNIGSIDRNMDLNSSSPMYLHDTG